MDAVTLRAEGKVGFLVALPLLYPCLGLLALPSSTKEEPDYALRALMLLVYALFREAYGDTVEPGMAIMSVHHKASIAKEGGFTWFSRACSCDREAATLIEADVAADLVARALSHGLGPPLGKPQRSLAYGYFGGGLTRQPAEIASIVIRTRHVGMTAAVVAAIRLVSRCWPGKENVLFNDDRVMSDQDIDPLHRALSLMEPVFRTLLTGSLDENLRNLLKALGTGGTAEPQRPSPQELLRVQMETDQCITAGPEDEFEPDWGAGPGTTGLELPSMAESEAPVDRGTVEVGHRLSHGARLGIDIGGVLMRTGDVRNPANAASALVRRTGWP